ncbi:hypothetical protein IC230_16520 [Spirosoma sp. BT704]|uniref:Uncharacterized protein n=2 Tax=Spirosoma validum TaxID=2771355 RepID=A0A927B339_9BACT|nr:hypothetical protein [Spirosoma validum]
MSNVIASILLSASTFINPIKSTTLPFEASAYVTINNHIRVAVQKSPDVPVVFLLRDKSNDILFRQIVSKKEANYVVKLDVHELTDGQYVLEVKSAEGSIRKQLNVVSAPVQNQTRVVAVL